MSGSSSVGGCRLGGVYEDRTVALTWRTFWADPPEGWQQIWHEYVRSAEMTAVGEPTLEWYDSGVERVFTARGSCRGEFTATATA